MIQDLLKIEDYSEFHKQIQTLTIPELEEVIKFLDLPKNREINRDKMERCLGQRKRLLTKQFECSPENLERMRNVANLVKKHTEILRKKGNELYAQMLKIWQEKKNEPFSDFYVKLSLCVPFNDEDSILHLPDDNSGSDYIKMAEILDNFHNRFERNLTMCNNSIHYNSEKLEQSFDMDDDMKSHNNCPLLWEGLGRKFPELQKIPITWEFHHLIDHTEYALQDIIRINDVWGEVNVCWQHITDSAGKILCPETK